jgi:hypothetical protein
MIELQKQYPVEKIGQQAYDNIEEYNRVLTNIKALVKSLLDNGNDAEDIAKICWHCGFDYATSYYIEEGKLKL